MKILIIDNYETPDSQSIQRFQEKIRVCSKSNCAAIRFNDPALLNHAEESDAIVLSGSGELLSQEQTVKKYWNEINLIQKANLPVLGICFGHQLIGTAYGSKVIPMNGVIKGFREVKIVHSNSLFNSLPEIITVYESHREMVEKIPEDFILLASSEDCKIEAMRHRNKPVYGIQFHAEYYDPYPHGKIVLENFFGML